jgi:hypothetical protein
MRDDTEHIIEDQQGRALRQAEQRLDPGQVTTRRGAHQDRAQVADEGASPQAHYERPGNSEGFDRRQAEDQLAGADYGQSGGRGKSGAGYSPAPDYHERYHDSPGRLRSHDHARHGSRPVMLTRDQRHQQ